MPPALFLPAKGRHLLGVGGPPSLVKPAAGTAAGLAGLPGAGRGAAQAAAPRRQGQLASAVRTAAVWSLLMGRGVRSLSADIARRSVLAVGWSLATVQDRRLSRLGRGWLVLRRWHVIVGVLLTAKALQLAWRLAWWLVRGPERRDIEQRLKDAISYEEWSGLAQQLDEIRGLGGHRRRRRRLLDEPALAQRRGRLWRLRELGDARGLMFALRVDLARQAGSVKDGWVGGVMFALRVDLARQAGSAKDGSVAEHLPHSELRPLQEFATEVREALEFVAECPDVGLEDRLSFFRELRHVYGRTGLCFSGGASFGRFHFGVFQVLFQANLLPRVFTGSSAGSIAAATICTRTDAELAEAMDALPRVKDELSTTRFFSHDTGFHQMKHFITQGTLHDATWFHEKLRNLYGDLTFAEAYQRTGRVLNISVSAHDIEQPYRLLNYLTAPNVLVRSGVAASCSFPLFFQAQDLLTKDAQGNIRSLTPEGSSQLRRWIDGSIQADLPMRGISEQFNVNFFLVSQCNPHLIPIISLRRALPSALGRLLEAEFKHWCSQLLHFFPQSHFFSFMRQPWEGDISMVLPHGALPFARASFNLTEAELETAMQEGRVATWSKLSAIQASCEIEVSIDSCLRSLTTAARAQRTQANRQLAASMRRSLPSWLHVPGLGMSAPPSRQTSSGWLPQPSSQPHLLGSLDEAAGSAASSLDRAGGSQQRLGTPAQRAGSRLRSMGGSSEGEEVEDEGEQGELEQPGGSRPSSREGGAAAPSEGGSGGSAPSLQRQEVSFRGWRGAEGAAGGSPEASTAEPGGALPGGGQQLEGGMGLWRDLALLGGMAGAQDYGLDVMAL